MATVQNTRNLKVGDVISLGKFYPSGNSEVVTFTVTRVEEKSWYASNSVNGAIARRSYGTIEEWYQCKGFIGWFTLTSA